jgi:polyisoprenoid-binding protein YceI
VLRQALIWSLGEATACNRRLTPHAAQYAAQSDLPTLKVSMTLHGATFDYVVPVELQVEPDKLVIRGDMTMQHEDFGLTPFSAAGGLLRVADQLELQFMLVARRI